MAGTVQDNTKWLSKNVGQVLGPHILHQSRFPVIFFHAFQNELSSVLNPLRAYAKINLGLLVHDKRPDGFHNIETVFHRIDLFDEITLEESDDLQVLSAGQKAPGGEANICHTAATLVQKHLGIRNGVKISIRKNIPVGAGLGGGSSDAATVLRALPQFWGHSVDDASLQKLALQLGSDVPYFLGNGSALGRGRGEILEYFDLDILCTILVCYPNIHVSTAWAYQQVAPSGAGEEIDLKAILIDGMKNPSSLRGKLRNDFEPSVFKKFPVVKEVKEMMVSGGADFALISGSGSTVFGLFDHGDAALAIEREFQDKGWLTFLARPHFKPA